MSLSLLARGSRIFSLLFLLSTSISAQSILYVNQQNVSPTDGLSWANAFDNLSDAVAAANLNPAVSEIWLAQGTYQPSSINDQNDFWLWPDGVSLYGGFIGNETNPSQSDPEKNTTILDGNIGDAALVSDNSMNLITLDNPSLAIVIAGLTFQNTGTSIASVSNALKINYQNNLDSAILEISHCTFRNNLGEKGSAIHLLVDESSYSNAQIKNCFFQANQSENGGALAFEKEDQSILEIEIQNSWFKDNEASRGGAAWGAGQNGTTPDLLEWNAEFMNCLFINNQATRGGAFYFQDSGSQFSGRAQNCTFFGNEASVNGHSIYLSFNGGGEFVNNIHWDEPTENASIFFALNDGNLAVSHVMMNNLFTDAANVISGEPLFFDSSADDFRLKICSDAINVGNNFGLPINDIRGKGRQYEIALDLGAYEMDGSEIVLLPATENTADADRWITDPDGWTHYLDCNQSTRLISLKTSGQDIGTPGVDNFNVAVVTDSEFGSIGINLTEADYFSDPGFFISNRRYWKVENANAFASPVRLRFYYTDQDIQDIEALADEPIDIESLRPFKVSGADAFALDVMDGGGTFESYQFAENEGSGIWTAGESGGVDYIEFLVNSFSAGAIGYNDQNSLPLELVNFSGRAEGTKALLNWETQSEKDFSHFEIQHSLDQAQFKTIGLVNGAGNSNDRRFYSYEDLNPGLLTNYYRLKMINVDESFDYSPLVNVNFSNFSKDRWRLFPNPGFEAVYLVLPARAHGLLSLTIINDQGQIMKNIEIENYAGDRIILPVAELAAGIYFIQAKGRWINEYNSFVKIK